MKAGAAGLSAMILASLVQLACVLDVPCSCGRSYSVGTGLPGDPRELVPASHPSSAHCTCYCAGVGDAVRMPPAHDCGAFEVACTTEDGAEATFRCFSGLR